MELIFDFFNKKNIKDINIFSSYYKGGTGWKHGFPRIELFNELEIWIIG